MPMPVLFGLGIAASIAGTVVGVVAAKEQASAQKEILELQKRAEAKRREQMEAEARRRRLEILRDQQRAKSLALSNATAQGADQSGSSAVPGAYGQIQGQGGSQQQGLQQNLDIGRQIFGINSMITDQQMRIADAQGMAAFGSGISSLGGMAMNIMPQMKSLTGQFGAAFGTGTAQTPSPFAAPFGSTGIPIPRPRPYYANSSAAYYGY